MEYVHQLLLLPYAALWIPGVIFLIVVGAVAWCARHMSPMGSDSSGSHASETSGVTPLSEFGKDPRREQRQSARRNGNPIAIHLAHPDYKHEPQDAYLLDRSMGGMRLTAPHEIEVGTILSIRPTQAADMVPWIDLEVRSCRASKEFEGQFELGCQFVKTPPYSILLMYG